MTSKVMLGLSGVVAAPALWGRGFTGAGILVMNLDSGVDGQHPSLGPRWLGNTPGVLASDAWFDPVQGTCPTPCDYDFHGTLTLSVVTGLDSATADTVGVSFGSKWIAGAVVGGYEDACRALGLSAGLVEVAGMALARTAFPEGSSGEGLLLNWDEGYLTLVLARGAWPILVRTLSGAAVATTADVLREVSSTLLYYRERLYYRWEDGWLCSAQPDGPWESVAEVSVPMGLRGLH